MRAHQTPTGYGEFELEIFKDISRPPPGYRQSTTSLALFIPALHFIFQL
jgi:hypothetical protein